MVEDRTGVVARLDALEAAWKGATPGPWSAEPNYRLEKGCRCLSCWEPIEGSWDINPIDGPDCPEHGCWHNVAISQADAAAIVAEHNAMPDLLAVVRGVLALADDWERMCDWITAPGDRELTKAASASIRTAVAAALGEA